MNDSERMSIAFHLEQFGVEDWSQAPEAIQRIAYHHYGKEPSQKMRELCETYHPGSMWHYPTMISHDPAEYGWCVLGTGQGPYIVFSEKLDGSPTAFMEKLRDQNIKDLQKRIKSDLPMRRRFNPDSPMDPIEEFELKLYELRVEEAKEELTILLKDQVSSL